MIDDNTRFVSLKIPAVDIEINEYQSTRSEEEKSVAAVDRNRAVDCPDCGVGLIRLGHCFTCPVCGYGSCS